MRRPDSSRLGRLAAAGVAAALAASLAATAAPAQAGPARPKPEPDIKVQLLSFNDYHGHLEADTPGTITSGETEVTAGGSAYLARHLRELRKGRANSFTVAAGDLIGGSPFLSGLFHDEPSVESLNAMGMDVSGVGNHEFDEGVRELRRMQRGGCHPEDGCYFEDAPYPGADFTWLAANVQNSAGNTALRPYSIKRVEGRRIGFIGMTLEGTDELVAQSGIEGWTFKDEVRTANALVPELQSKGVKAIVVLLHEGGVQTGTYNGCRGISGPVVGIAERLHPQIDMVITGHTHEAYNCVIDDPKGKPRRVTSAASFGRVVTAINFRMHPGTGQVRRPTVRARNHIVTQDVTPVAALNRIIRKWGRLADDLGNRQIGTVTEDITRAYESGGADDRGAESDAGNLIADAQLWATRENGAQIAFMNPGGVRADFEFDPDGVVTYAEAYTVQPFGNLLSTIPMTGEQIQTALEQQCNTTRQFQLGVSEGFTYTDTRTVDPTNSRSCTSITVSDMELNGEPIDLAQTYQVTVNNFLVDGGDGFEVFAEIPAEQRVGGGEDLAALLDYFEAEGPLSPPGTDRVNEVLE
jgi:5'-nucleotidase